MIARRIFTRFFLLLALAAPIASAFAQAPPAVGPLPDSERRTAYSITGNTCICNVNFALYGTGSDVDSWISVWVNGVRVLSTDPTFGWSLSSTTGPLSTIPRPITNAVLTFNAVQTATVQIVGAERPRQLSQFTEGRGVAARDLNQRFTEDRAIARELWDKTNDLTGRGLFFAPGNTTGPMPSPAACAGAILGFDNSGLNPLCVAAVSLGAMTVPNTTVPGDVVLFGGTTGKSIIDGGPIRLPNQAAPAIYVNGIGSPATCTQNSSISSPTCAVGNDTTGNGTTAAPYLTLSKALSVFWATDIGVFHPTIILAYGSSTNYGGVTCANAQVGGANANTIFVTGDSNNTSAVHIVAPNGTDGIYASDGCILRLEFLTIDNQGTASSGIRTGQGGIMDVQTVTCGSTFNSTTAPCIALTKDGATNLGLTTLTVAGCGTSIISMTGGTFNAASVNNPALPGNIAIPSGITCSNGFVNATGPAKLLNFSSSTFTGSGLAGSSGVRAILTGPVWLDTGGAGCNGVFPSGMSACHLTQGAQDDAGDPPTAPIGIAQLTIGTLPTCNSSAQGQLSYVTNGVASPTYRASVSTTGSTLQLVGCDGSGWTYH